MVGRDLVAARGELTLACVDDDERHPQRAVQSARDRLRLALDAELRQPGHVLGAKLGSVVVNATKKLCDWLFSPGAAATGGGAGGGRGGGGAAPPCVEDLEALLRQRGFCAAAAPPGWVWPAREEQLRAAAKAVVLVEEGLGLAPLPLPDGRALTARPFEPPAAAGGRAADRFPEFEVAAVAAMLRSRLQPNELEAQVVWHAAAICDAAASLGPGGWISGGGGRGGGGSHSSSSSSSSSSHYDQQVRGLAAALWLRHCDGAGLCPPLQQAPQPAAAAAAAASTAAASKPAAAAAGAAASSVAAPRVSDAADAGSTDARSSSTPASPATTAPTAAAATPLAALPYPALAALLLRHGHDAAVLTDPQLYGTAFALLWLDARAAAAASTAAACTAAGGTASGAAGVGVGGTAAGRDGGDGGGGGPGGVAAAPQVGRLPDGGGWVRVVLPTAFAGTAAARAAVAQVLGSGLSCGELVAALRGLGAAPPPGSEKSEIAGLLAELVIAAAAAAAAS